MDRIIYEKFLEKASISVEPINDGHVFDILIEQYAEEEKSVVRMVDYHTNIVYISKNDVLLSMERIWEFTNSVEIQDIKDTILGQMDYNWAIAMEGMNHKYGANIGKVLSEAYGDGVQNLACAMAAAGSDARMDGCGGRYCVRWCKSILCG